jgi:hypothetical protein
MKALLERLDCPAAIVRVGPALEEHGDLYEWAATLVWYDGLDAPPTICGLDRPLTPAVWRAFRAMLYREGVPTARYERHRAGTVREALVHAAQENTMSPGSRYRITLGDLVVTKLNDDGSESPFWRQPGAEWASGTDETLLLVQKVYIDAGQTLNEAGWARLRGSAAAAQAAPPTPGGGRR